MKSKYNLRDVVLLTKGYHKGKIGIICERHNTYNGMHYWISLNKPGKVRLPIDNQSSTVFEDQRHYLAAEDEIVAVSGMAKAIYGDLDAEKTV